MKYGTFKCLATDLRPYIVAAMGTTSTLCYNRNGQVTPDVRLACALRWFAGRSAYDIMTTYSIGHTDTIKSVWYVVDAVNRHPRFKTVYPDNHDKQQSIARGFQNASSAGIDCCAGAVDGILRVMLLQTDGFLDANLPAFPGGVEERLGQKFGNAWNGQDGIWNR